jgi:hypothetical protein
VVRQIVVPCAEKVFSSQYLTFYEPSEIPSQGQKAPRRLGKGDWRGAAMLAAILAGARPARGTCPVATVAISGDETGDQFIGSPEVKTPVGRAEMLGRIRQGGEQLNRS